MRVSKLLQKAVQAHEHTDYHQVQAHVIQPAIELARASVEGCPWKSS